MKTKNIIKAYKRIPYESLNKLLRIQLHPKYIFCFHFFPKCCIAALPIKHTFLLRTLSTIRDSRYTIYGSFKLLLKGYINQIDFISNHDLREKHKIRDSFSTRP